MKLGISTYSLTWSIGVPGYERPAEPLTALGMLRRAKEHGVAVVQFADNLALHRLSAEELEDIRRTAADWNIVLELGLRGTDPELLTTYLALAQLLGSVLVRTLITEADIEGVIPDLRKMLPYFEEAGVKLAIENHGLHTTRQLVSLFQSLDSPALGCCLDTVNSFSALDCPDRVIADLAPYTVNLHVKDFDIRRIDHQMGFVITGTAAGEGRLDIAGVLETLRGYGRDPNVILELWTPFTNSVEETVALENEWFGRSLEYLKRQHFGG